MAVPLRRRANVKYMDALTVAQKIWKDSYLFETDIHAIIRCGRSDDGGTIDNDDDPQMPCRSIMVCKVFKL